MQGFDVGVVRNAHVSLRSTDQERKLAHPHRLSGALPVVQDPETRTNRDRGTIVCGTIDCQSMVTSPFVPPAVGIDRTLFK